MCDQLLIKLPRTGTYATMKSRDRSSSEAGSDDGILDLTLTHFFMATPKGDLSAEMTLGTKNTVWDLFDGIRRAFNHSSEDKIQDITKVIIAPKPDLGVQLKDPVIIEAHDNNDDFRQFRRHLVEAWKEERRDSDVLDVVFFVTVCLGNVLSDE